MLHATYKASPYIFYLSTEDNRIDTSKTDTDNLKYLFKLTNDMSGVIYYAFAQNQVVYDRYTKLELTHSLTPSYYSGEVNLIPNGYWNYELYEYSGNITAATTCATVPDPTTGDLGTLKISLNNGATTVYTYPLTSAVPNLIDQVSVDLDAEIYYLYIYDNCGVKIPAWLGGVAEIPQVTAQADGRRWLEITDYTTTAGGCTLTIKSDAPVGYSYDFMNDDSGSNLYYQVTNITSDPQITTHTFTSILEWYSLRMYDATGGAAGGGSLVWATADDPLILVHDSSAVKYGIGFATAWNPVSIDGAGTVLSKGNMWFTARYGSVFNVLSPDYYALQGLITQGKLYVEEPVGEEQVQYTKYEAPPSTNTIYYGQ
tara:strand:- start:24 stop:1136 length:1113 start_codon:yes stop_codon:yes gene_type:complete